MSASNIRLRVRETDGSGSITPTPDSPRSGLRSKWTGGGPPSNASLRPGGWAESRSPSGSIYNGVSRYANSPASPPMLPYSSPATVSPPLSGRTPSGGWWLPPRHPVALPRPARVRAAGRTAGYAGLASTWTWHTCLRPLPAHAVDALPTPRDTAKKDD